MSSCLKCGEELQPGATSCPKCGNVVTSPYMAPASMSQAPRKRGFRWVPLIIVLGVFGSCVYAVHWYRQAHSEYVAMSRVWQRMHAAAAVKACVSDYYEVHQAMPAAALEDCTQRPADGYRIALGEQGAFTMEFHFKSEDDDGGRIESVEGTIVFTPTVNEHGGITWDCRGGDLPKKYRPSDCKP